MVIQGEVILKKGRDASVRRFHPWVFSGGVQSVAGKLKDGDWVCVKSSSGGVLGYGHYQKGTITVRMLSFSEAPPSSDFFADRFSQAIRQRMITHVANAETNSFRLVHGEGDGLSGLIVDLYHGVAVMQAHSPGFHSDRGLGADALTNALPDWVQAVYFKDSAGQDSGYLKGMGVIPHVILEHGNRFYVDWETGQKTGFFLDQRENRKLLGEFVKGARVLNTFCYTGGFSVYALKSGATLVHSVDASEKAIEMTNRNVELNGFNSETHKAYACDTFDFIKDKENVYDVIVLDPPAFAKHKDARHQAMKGYQRLNAEAFRVIKPNGILFTFSCSQVVDRQLFYDTIVSSAIQSGREISVLHHLSQPSDHPVSIYHPEGAYLKGLVLFVK